MLKKNYLLIPGSSIVKRYYQNSEIKEDNLLQNNIFDKYQIPSKYRGIILRNCYNLESRKCDMYEVTTNKEFFLEAISSTEEANITTMEGHFDYELATFIKGPFKEYSNQETIEFMQGIIDEGLAKNYELAINDILTRYLVKEDSFLGKIRKKLRNK